MSTCAIVLKLHCRHLEFFEEDDNCESFLKTMNSLFACCIVLTVIELIDLLMGELFEDWTLQCWKGYHQSLRPCQGGLYLNIDTAVSAFYKPIKVDRYLEEILGPNWRGVGGRGEHRVKSYLKGVLVSTSHGGIQHKWSI